MNMSAGKRIAAAAAVQPRIGKVLFVSALLCVLLGAAVLYLLALSRTKLHC